MSDPPLLLLDYQAKWIGAAAKHPVRVIEKSRRIGISWCEACRLALDAAERDGVDGWYVGYNKEMSQEYIRDAAHWSKNYQLAASAIDEGIFQDDDEREIHYYVIRYNSGKRVTALSSRPSNLRGKQGNIVIDEAAFHDDLDGLIKSAMATKIWGGTVAIVSTHFGVESEFNAIVEDCKAGRRSYYLQRTTLDDAIADGLYRRICEVAGQPWSPDRERQWREDLISDYGDHAAEELFCIPSRSGGIYMAPAMIEDRMDPTAPVLSLALDDDFGRRPEDHKRRHVEHWIAEHIAPELAKLPTDRAHYFGQDFGRVSDLSVIAPMTLLPDMRRRVPFIVELRNVPHEQQKQILFAIGDGLPRFSGAGMDAGGNGEYLAEQAVYRYGETLINAVKITEPWHAENWPPLKAALEDDLISYPRYDGILMDLKSVRVINGIPKVPKVRERDAKGMIRHGDFAIAAALGYASTRSYSSVYAVRRIEYGNTDRREKRSDPRRRVRTTQGFRGRKGIM